MRATKNSTRFLFEFKACGEKKELEAKANEALSQIDEKRYGADIGGGKRLVKAGIAFCGKLSKVKCKSF
jgi:hypothetical protein